MIPRKVLMLAGIAVLLSGCFPEKQETTTRGHLTVLLTESAAPVLVEEVNQFLGLYGSGGANVDYEIVTTEEAIRRFVEDTVRCVFAMRALEPEERRLVSNTPDLQFTEIAVAYDGIAVVAHQKNAIDRVTVSELRDVLTGKTKRWEQLSRARTMRGRIDVIYQDSSDVSWFLEQRVLKDRPLRNDVRRSPSSLQTLRSVADSRSSIACVGLGWIDSAHAPVKVLEVAESENPADTTYQLAPESIGMFYSPHPAHIYRKYYPLRRTIYVYTRAPLGSLASGFTWFVSSKDGQQIFLQRNLVPGTQIIRLRQTE